MENLSEVRIENMTSSRGNKVANQFVVECEGLRAFKSYDSMIVAIKHGEVFLDEKYWDYSVTTGKYRNQFLGETKKETEAKIKSGEYKLVNLNG